jgi:hypothetical protein
MQDMETAECNASGSKSNGAQLRRSGGSAFRAAWLFEAESYGELDAGGYGAARGERGMESPAPHGSDGRAVEYGVAGTAGDGYGGGVPGVVDDDFQKDDAGVAGEAGRKRVGGRGIIEVRGRGVVPSPATTASASTTCADAADACTGAGWVTRSGAGGGRDMMDRGG